MNIAILLMLISIVSKGVGFFREILISYFYGATNVSDAYFISLTIPVAIFSFIGDSIINGYIPMFNRISNDINVKESHRFTNVLLTDVLFLSTLIVLLVQVFTKQIVSLFAAGFENQTLRLAVEFTRITIFGIYFAGVIFILTGFLQVRSKFLAPALLGFVYNFIIVISIFLSVKFGVMILSLGILISSFLQSSLLTFISYKEGFLVELIIDFKNKHIIRFGKIIFPLLLGTSISQINVLIDKTIASSLGVGSVSALNYADRINSFVLSTVVMSISVIIYPLMTKSVYLKNIIALKQILMKSILLITYLLVPATLGSVLFSKNLVSVLFMRGAFDLNAYNMTSSAFLFYSIGMIGMGLREIFSRVYFSMQDVKTPVQNAFIGLVINLILNLLLSRFFGVGGLAFATSISAIVTSILLFSKLKKKIGPFSDHSLKITISKIVISSLIMGGVSKVSFYLLDGYFSTGVALGFTILIGVLSYLLITYIMKIEDLDFLFKFTKGMKKI